MVGSQPKKVFEDVVNYELNGGNWSNPDETVAYLVDKNPNNGEITIVDTEIKHGVGAVRGSDGTLVKIVELSLECF